MTAPNFRPFEEKFKGKRHLGPANFLHSEEGGEWDDGSDDDSYTVSEPSNDTPVSKKRKRGTSNTIYIDQVMERASR